MPDPDLSAISRDVNASNKLISEPTLIALVGAVQFINIVDFMMVMPLGPSIAPALHIPLRHIGYIGGSYTLAAAAAGLAGALVLDRFPRRTMILLTLAGLIAATVSTAFAGDLSEVIAARLAAGLFGGPLTACALSAIIDAVPPERRGAAMGKVMGAFAAASVLGVPFGLELAHRFGWQAPFYGFGLLGGAVWIAAYALLRLPPRRDPPLSVRAQIAAVRELLRRPVVWAGYAFTALSMGIGFMIIPNIAGFLQFNRGFPARYLGGLYLLGGIVSFFGMRFAGRLTDRTSAFLTGSGFTALLAGVIFLGFIQERVPITPVLLFPLFMLSMTGRNVAAQTLSSKIPPPALRAAFMSVQSALTHLASAVGAGYTSLMLDEHEGRLIGMDRVATVAIALSLLIPLLFRYVEKRVKVT